MIFTHSNVRRASFFAKISYLPDFLEPYPTFGVSLRSLFATVAVIYGTLWLVWSGVMLWVSSYGESEGSIVLVGFGGLLMLVTYFGTAYGLECANALLDTSPRHREPVLIRHLRREFGKTIRGASVLAIATISPIDQPTRQFDLDWNSCSVKWSVAVSPFAAVRLGRGAFGVPWVELPVECRPLALSDRPLVGNFVLGHEPAVVVVLAPTDDPRGASDARAERREGLLMHLDQLKEGRGDTEEIANLTLNDAREVLSADGQAEFLGIMVPLTASDSSAKIDDVLHAAARVVEADEKHLNVGYRLSIWRQAIDASAPGLPIVIIEQGVENRKPAAVPCQRCTMVSSEDVDEDIFELFTGGSEVRFEGDHIFLADRAGKLAFKASLSETARASQLAGRAKVLAATK